MKNLSTIIWLLPIVFMIHDFEEIIFFKFWIKKNWNYLEKKLPNFSKKYIEKLKKISVPAFSLAVFEEFLLLSLITFTAIYFEFYHLWLAAFMTFSIHLIIHIFQWIYIKMYIPALASSILLLPYSIYSFIKILNTNYFSLQKWIFLTIFWVLIMFLNLIFIHKFWEKFDKKFNQ